MKLYEIFDNEPAEKISWQNKQKLLHYGFGNVFQTKFVDGDEEYQICFTPVVNGIVNLFFKPIKTSSMKKIKAKNDADYNTMMLNRGKSALSIYTRVLYYTLDFLKKKSPNGLLIGGIDKKGKILTKMFQNRLEPLGYKKSFETGNVVLYLKDGIEVPKEILDQIKMQA